MTEPGHQPKLPAAARLGIVIAAGCAGLLTGCGGSAVPSRPSAAQLISSAMAALGGQVCGIDGTVVLSGGPNLVLEDIKAISAGYRFSATVTDRYRTARPFTDTERVIDDGTALYLQSGDAPALVAGRWVRFPSWPSLGQRAYNTEYSELTQQPGSGGDVLAALAMRSTEMPYRASCTGLVTQLRNALNGGQLSGVTAARLDGRPVFTFTLNGLFSILANTSYQITLSSTTPAQVLRVTTGSHVLSLNYPTGTAPISAPPAAAVIPAAHLPALLNGHN